MLASTFCREKKFKCTLVQIHLNFQKPLTYKKAKVLSTSVSGYDLDNKNESHEI